MKRSTILILTLLFPVAGCFSVEKKSGIQIHENIIIESPLPGEIVTSPLIVKGKARGVWFFEASFPITLEDASGNVLSIGIATAEGEWMTPEFVDFTAEISFVSVGSAGYLLFQKDNPSGLPELDESVRIPVTF